MALNHVSDSFLQSSLLHLKENLRTWRHDKTSINLEKKLQVKLRYCNPYHTYFFLKKAIMLFKILLNKNSNQYERIVYTADESTCGFVGTLVPNELH